MFDNSVYSNCNIHRKLQQALAQVLGELGSAKGVTTMLLNRQRKNEKNSLWKIPLNINHRKTISTQEKHFGRSTGQKICDW